MRKENSNDIKAFPKLMEKHIDLAVTVIQTPHTDGLSLAKKMLGEISPVVPVITVSTPGKEAYREQGLRTGVNFCVPEPFPGFNFISKITVLQSFCG